jgi:DNA-binding beta-propeller fold protein YncE/mono/diheme cytochrome c family protein
MSEAENVSQSGYRVQAYQRQDTAPVARRRWPVLRIVRALLVAALLVLAALLYVVWTTPAKVPAKVTPASPIAPTSSIGRRAETQAQPRAAGGGMMGMSRPPITSAAPEYASPIALAFSPDGGTLYVAEHTGRSIAVVDVGRREVVRRISLTLVVQGLAVSSDNATLFVTCGEANGRLYRIDAATGRMLENVEMGHTPLSPVITPDGKWLLVCNRYNNTVSMLALSGEPRQVRIPVPREPVAAAVTPDSRLAVVANHLQAGRADVNFVTAVVSLLDTEDQKKIADIPLANGSHSLRDVCISPDGRYAYVTHVLGRFQLPTTQVDRGWMNTNAFSIIDLQERRCLATVLLDDVDLGAANPWGIAHSPDGRWLCVCHSGTHELSVIDRKGLHAKVQNARDPNGIADDLVFLRGLRQRLPLTGQGPRAVAISGQKAYVSLYFADAIDVVSLDQTPSRLAGTIRLGPEPALTLERRGEMLFHDGDQCFQKWQTCASCHPDGATDALNWDLLNDGIGNPKNAKSLLLSHVTPPVMITGVRPTAEFGVRAGMRGILFMALDEESAKALDAYLKAMKPIPSPRLVNGQLNESAQRGKQAFATAGCAGCHNGPYFTDMKMHVVGTGLGPDAGQPWDTPTLINVWRTAPYLYDGRAVTIREVLTTENPQNRHGVTSILTAQEIDDLAEYVLSL